MLESHGLQPFLADVDADDTLHDLYDWRVPVVLVDERVVAEGRIDEAALTKQLREVGLIA